VSSHKTIYRGAFYVVAL